MEVPPPKNQIILSIAALVFLFLVLGVFKGCEIYNAISQHSNFTPPPEAVTSAIADLTDWPDTFSSVGSLVAAQGATLSSEEAGTISKIAMESGHSAKAGDIIIELDTAMEEAQLNGASAALEKAEKTFERSQKLKAVNAVAKDEFDQAAASYRLALADVESIKARINKKRIVAPFDGHLGVRRVNVGDYVPQGAPLIPLYSMDPLFVDFALPQAAISKIKVGQKVNIKIQSISGEVFVGEISAIDPNISENSRTFNARATLKNSKNLLRPGMFASVEVFFGQSDKALVIPITSVNFAPFGDSVFVVDKKSEGDKTTTTVRQQFVKLGRRRGDFVAIESGIKPGEEVATSGLFKLRPGAAVLIDNSVKQGDSLSPTPPNT